MRAVLVGLENVGKSTIFRLLTGDASGEETNVRGSTVVCREASMPSDGRLVDTPGIRVRSDAETTRIALGAAGDGDAVVLVARACDLRDEIETLLDHVDVGGRPAALAVTFADRASSEVPRLVEFYRRRLGIPVVTLDARRAGGDDRAALADAVASARPLTATAVALARREPPACCRVPPPRTAFEAPRVGPLAALALLLLLFGGPVAGAFRLSDALQPIVDLRVIAPLKAQAAALPGLAGAVVAGDYGLLTLGWYSFLWAFPVVLGVGVAAALADESGLGDRAAAALDPWMRRIGLHGRDLVPVTAGYGCNVVAVFQTRGCSAATRPSCAALVALGSACSYQIGATSAVLGAAGQAWLFVPYLALLVVAGAAHVRLFHGALTRPDATAITRLPFLQPPTWRGTSWRVRQVSRLFLLQAMPIFLGICIVAAVLEHFGVLSALAAALAPLLGAFGLPADTAPGLVFAVVRKDGLLVLTHDGGSVLRALSPAQVLTLAWLGSASSACLVTLWTVSRELGGRFAVALAARQAFTAVAVGLLLARLG